MRQWTARAQDLARERSTTSLGSLQVSRRDVKWYFLSLKYVYETQRATPPSFCAPYGAETPPGRAPGTYSDSVLIRSHVSSRVTFTPFTSAGGGVRIMRSPSKRTLRTWGAVNRTGSQLASTMVVSVLPSNV